LWESTDWLSILSGVKIAAHKLTITSDKTERISEKKVSLKRSIKSLKKGHPIVTYRNWNQTITNNKRFYKQETNETTWTGC